MINKESKLIPICRSEIEVLENWICCQRVKMGAPREDEKLVGEERTVSGNWHDYFGKIIPTRLRCSNNMARLCCGVSDGINYTSGLILLRA